MGKPGSKCIEFEAAVGSNSKNGQPGNGGGSNQTPSGLLFSVEHNGNKYNKNNSVGMIGTNSENDNTQARGVVIHGTTGNATEGCIGLKGVEKEGAEVKEVIEMLKPGSPIFNLFPGKSVSCAGEPKSGFFYKSGTFLYKKYYQFRGSYEPDGAK